MVLITIAGGILHSFWCIFIKEAVGKFRDAAVKNGKIGGRIKGGGKAKFN